jgi:hypothetical protein
VIINDSGGGDFVAIKQLVLALFTLCMPMTHTSSWGSLGFVRNGSVALATGIALKRIYQQTDKESVSVRIKKTCLTLINAPLRQYTLARIGLIYLTILCSLSALKGKNSPLESPPPTPPAIPSLSIFGPRTPSSNLSDDIDSARPTVRQSEQRACSDYSLPDVKPRAGLRGDDDSDLSFDEAQSENRIKAVKEVARIFFNENGTPKPPNLDDGEKFEELMDLVRSSIRQAT